MLHLIVNLRAAGAEPATVTVGNCTVDLRPVTKPGRQPEPVDPRQAIYEQFGGDAYRRMVGKPRADVVDGAEYQPALEVEQ